MDGLFALEVQFTSIDPIFRFSICWFMAKLYLWHVFDLTKRKCLANRKKTPPSPTTSKQASQNFSNISIQCACACLPIIVFTFASAAYWVFVSVVWCHEVHLRLNPFSQYAIHIYIVRWVTPVDQLWRRASVWLRLFIFIANVKKNVCLAHNIISMNAKPEAYVCEPKSRLLMRVLARVLCLDICIVAFIIFRAPFLWWLGIEMACNHYYGIYFCKYD